MAKSNSTISLCGKKVGMTHVFDGMGALVPVTVLYVDSNVVIGTRDIQKNGYTAKILATFTNKPSRFIKPAIGLFPENIAPRKKIFEVRGYNESQLGDEITLDVFKGVVFVDVVARSKGRGYQGVMKRHGAHGGPASHGSKFHRAIGSTGQSATPSRVRKGTKGAGRMGNATTTIQNLRIMDIDIENNLLVVQGAVPGSKGAEVLIKQAVKKG